MLESYTGTMKNIQVKNVSDEVHRVWKTRAAAAGMSLQEYLHRKLTQEAQRPTVAEVLARVEHRGGPKLDRDEIVSMLREDRESR
jgi:plasmid stability protein